MAKIPNALPRTSVGKIIPAPFKRPSIDLDKVGREWKWVPPETISEGDIIPDLGLIKRVNTQEGRVFITGAGKTKWFYLDEDIWAFTSKT